MDWTKEVAGLSKLAVETKEAVSRDFPFLDVTSDVRITCFAKYVNVLNSAQLTGWFWDNCLLRTDWWDHIGVTLDADRQIIAGEFDRFVKIAVLQTAFSAVESSIRAMIRAIDPNAHHLGTGSFKSTYDDLLKKRLAKPLQAGVELLDFARMIRNTLHNNGVHFGRDTHLSFNGATYAFLNGRPVDFVTWELLLEVLRELLFLMDSIVRDAQIQSLQGTVSDPFTTP